MGNDTAMGMIRAPWNTLDRAGPACLARAARTAYRSRMANIGDSIDLQGTLVRDGAGFAIRAERGILYYLQLHRVPVDHVEKRVRVIGTLIGDRLIETEGLSPA